jgi:TldD protein
MSKCNEALSLLSDVARDQDGFVELRYHSKTSRAVHVEKGRIEKTQSRTRAGVGVRVLDTGGFGIASTSVLEKSALRSTLDAARAAARASGRGRRGGAPNLAPVELARGRYEMPGIDEVLARPLEEKISFATRLEDVARRGSSAVRSASCSYSEIYEEKAIVTTDGARVAIRLVRPELRIQAIAERDGELSSGFEAVGATGGWDCLFHAASAEELATRAAAKATDLLSAGRPEGGRAIVVLAPSIVGLLVHEAIGHTVEADFVQAGSVAAGKIGHRVASELVTLCDSGASEFYDGAGGSIPVDDEGVLAAGATIIEQGILRSYLHNRESAAKFGVAPTGNARAWEYSDQPLIRMRNTYLCPGDSTLEEIIASTPDGYLLEGARNGQADATGEFTFGVQEARRIRGGKLAELVRGVTITGIAFDVLGTVDAISSEFRWDLGSGYCGKGQPAKVDAGGPYIRCRALLGGEQ